MMPGSPASAPAAMKWRAKSDLPEPEGPTKSADAPAGIPPDIIASRASTHVDARVSWARGRSSLRGRIGEQDVEPGRADELAEVLMEPRHDALCDVGIVSRTAGGDLDANDGPHESSNGGAGLGHRSQSGSFKEEDGFGDVAGVDGGLVWKR